MGARGAQALTGWCTVLSCSPLYRSAGMPTCQQFSTFKRRVDFDAVNTAVHERMPTREASGSTAAAATRPRRYAIICACSTQ